MTSLLLPTLAARLDDGDQQQLRASTAAGSHQRINEVLGALPVETETMLALRDPFTIHAGELASGLRPVI